MRIITFFFAILFLLSCRVETSEVQKPLAMGGWSLNAPESVISFITVKNSSVSESHNFQNFTGMVSADGDAIVTIDLASVETNIDIRNERMRTYLFETDTHRQASVSTHIDMKPFYELAIGQRVRKTIPFKVGLHGTVENIEADVFITRLAKEKVLVETRTPIHIYGGDFNLMAGIAKLQSLAKLASITPSVPVSVSLVFETKPVN